MVLIPLAVINHLPLELEESEKGRLFLLLLLQKKKIKVTLSHQRRCRGTEQI